MLSLHLIHAIFTVIVTAALDYSYFFMSVSTIIHEICHFFVLSTLFGMLVLRNSFSIIVLIASNNICVALWGKRLRLLMI